MGSSILIKRAFIKYGKDNFKKEIIWKCNNKKSLDQAEQYFIIVNNSQDKRYGYNISNGGSGTGMHSIETKKNMSFILKNRWDNDLDYKSKMIKNNKMLHSHTAWNKGKKMDKEFCISVSNCKKGITLSEETKKRMSLAQKGKNNPMYGRKVFDIWVEKYGYDEAIKKEQLRRMKISNFNKQQ